MQYLQASLARIELEEQAQQELGIEGFISFNEFLSGTRNNLNQFFKRIFNKEYTSIDDLPSDPKALTNALKKQKKEFGDLSKVRVYRPEDLNVPMFDLAEYLLEQSTINYTIIERLYRPMNKWLAGAVSIDGFEEKLWNDRDLSFNETEAAKKELGLMFRPSRDKELTPDTHWCGYMYGTAKEYQQTFEKLLATAHLGRDFDLELLQKEEKKLAVNIDRLLDMEAEGTIAAIPKATKKKIVVVLKAMIEETDHLVACNFLILTTLASWKHGQVALIEATK